MFITLAYVQTIDVLIFQNFEKNFPTLYLASPSAIYHLVLIFHTYPHVFCFISAFCQSMAKIHLLDYNVKFVKCQFLYFMKAMLLSFIHLLNYCERQSIVINMFSKALKMM